MTSGANVAILSHPSVEYFVYAMAVIGVSAVCVNLNWRMPSSSLLNSLDVSASTSLISSSHFETEARYLSAQRSLPLLWLAPPDAAGGIMESVLPSFDGDNLPAFPTNPLAIVRPSPSAIAVIMFTSGSTATPKAVPLSHRGLLWNCRQRLQFLSKAFNEPNAGTLSLLPNFHVIGENLEVSNTDHVIGQHK